jgi:Flp pilus assembly protein TadG
MNFGVRPPLSNRVACHATNTQQDFSLCLPAVAVAPGAPFCAPAGWRGSRRIWLGRGSVLGLTFAILETALVFFAGQTLETAVADSARLIMTGQAQTAGWTKDDFKTAVCNHIYGVFDCANGIYVDVKSYTSFSAITSDPPITDGNLDPSKVNYSPGDVGNIEVVTLYYQWPIYVSLLGNNLANVNANTRLLVSTAVFRNEPYH